MMRAVALLLAALPAALGEGVPAAKPQDQLLVYIYNKVHDHERLTRFDGGSCHYYDGNTYRDQLWSLEESSETPGWYFLVNFQRGGRYGYSDHAGCWDGGRSDDQLWRFVPGDDGYYYIENYEQKGCRMYAPGGVFCGPRHDDQLFKLVNVFQTTASWERVQSFCNTGKETLTSSFTWNVGYSETITNSVAMMQGTGTSLQESAALSAQGLDLSFQEYEDLRTSVTDAQRRAMSKETQATRTVEESIPAGECWALEVLRLDTTDSSSPASFSLTSGAYRRARCDAGDEIERATPLLL